ncbi:unnamed protein product, partial [Staurois parvus]
MWVRERRMEGEGGCRSCEGIGSRGQVVRRTSERILETSSMVVRSKVRSGCWGALQYEECRVGWKRRSEQWWGRGRGVMRGKGVGGSLSSDEVPAGYVE